jgi:hypothetical protein
MRTRLEAETSALLKLILCDYDELASTEPSEACDPYTLEVRKKRLKRKLWGLLRLTGGDDE